MATDILGVAFKADTSDLKKGANELDKVSASGTKAGRAAQKLQADFKKTGTAAKKTTGNVHKLSNTFRSAATNAAAFEGPLGGISGRLGAMSTLLKSVNPLMVGFGLAVSAAGIFMVAAVKEHDKLNIRNKKQVALLKATGFAAGFAAHELDEMAKAVALNTLASVEGAKDAQNVLLTFKSISEDVFGESLIVAQDLASVMGGDIKSAAMQLGKALEDPIAGLNALKRSGVSFSQTEKDLIKDMVAVGNAAGAQAFMLKTLKDQIGGAGAAEADSLSGATDTLSQNWQNLMVTLADTTGAASGVQSLVSTMGQAIDEINQMMNPRDSQRMAELWVESMDLKNTIKELEDSGDWNFFSTNVDLINTAKIELKAVNEELTKLQAAEEKKAEKSKQADDAKASRDKAIKAAMPGDTGQTAIPKQSFSSFKLADHFREMADEEVRINKEKNDKKLADDKALLESKKAMQQLEMSTTADLFGNLAQIAAAGGEESFQTYKRMAQAQAAVSAALAISNALAAPTGNPILNGAMAVSIGALAGVQIAQIEQQQYTGARAMGGQVSGGQSYVVGEQGREVITMGSQGGFVTPNHKLGGGENVTVVNQIGNNVSGNVRAELTSALPAIIAATTKAVRSGRR